MRSERCAEANERVAMAEGHHDARRECGSPEDAVGYGRIVTEGNLLPERLNNHPDTRAEGGRV